MLENTLSVTLIPKSQRQYYQPYSTVSKSTQFDNTHREISVLLVRFGV